VQDAVHLVKGARHLDGADVTQPGREHPQVLAADVHVLEAIAVSPRPDRLRCVADRKLAALVRRPHHIPLRRYELHVAGGATVGRSVAVEDLVDERRPVALEGHAAAQSGRDGTGAVARLARIRRSREARRQRRDAVAQRAVDLAAQLAANGHVRQRSAKQHGDGHRQPGHSRDARAQAHGSRSE
jgi:hypothetical protein